MKNGNLREDEGFDILINGVPRTFSDLQKPAYDFARELNKMDSGWLDRGD